MTNEEYLKQLAETEKATKRAELEAQKTQALTDIERTQAQTMPTYTAAKQQANVSSQIGAKNFAEYLASRGQAGGGLAAQYEMSRQNTLGGQLGQIGTQEQQALTQFGQQRADVGTQYDTSLANAYGNIDQQLSTNLYNEKLRQEQMAAAQAEAQARAQQQAFENQMAIDKFNLAVYNANKSSQSSVKTKLQDGLTRVNPATGKAQMVVDNKWVDLKYETKKVLNKITGKTENVVIAKKQEKFNKQGYFMNTPDMAVSFNNITPHQIVKEKDKIPVKKLTYQTWVNVNDGEYYIIKNDKPIQLTNDGLKKAVKDKLLTEYQVGQIKMDFYNSLQS